MLQSERVTVQTLRRNVILTHVCACGGEMETSLCVGGHAPSTSLADFVIEE